MCGSVVILALIAACSLVGASDITRIRFKRQCTLLFSVWILTFVGTSLRHGRNLSPLRSRLLSGELLSVVLSGRVFESGFSGLWRIFRIGTMLCIVGELPRYMGMSWVGGPRPVDSRLRGNDGPGPRPCPSGLRVKSAMTWASWE